MEAWNIYKYISKMETTKLTNKMEKSRQENANDEC